MPIITIKYEGKIYQRVISRKQGFYVMESKGIEYWFGKDFPKYPTTKGWHIVNGKILPEFMLQLVAIELEKLVSEHPGR